jgi:hypothetical protein
VRNGLLQLQLSVVKFVLAAVNRLLQTATSRDNRINQMLMQSAHAAKSSRTVRLRFRSN